jgi:hypothetical protein
VPPSLQIHVLANIQTEVFSVPTSVYLKYETKVWLPYFIKRHILRKKIAKPALIDTKSSFDTAPPTA